jgi:hypothetical protein
MSTESFAYGSDAPSVRRPDARAIKIGLAAFAVVLILGFFAKWVMDSERASERRVQATSDVPAAGLVTDEGAGSGTSGGVTAIDPVAQAAQAQAQATADLAVKSAMALAAESGSFADAGPGQLGAFEPSSTYTDGPSIGPAVVSVAATDQVWAAAVLSEDGTCFTVRTTLDGAVSKGRSTEACTGAAALDAPEAGW